MGALATVVRCLVFIALVCVASDTFAQTTALFVDQPYWNPPGSRIQQTFTLADGQFTVTRNSDSAIAAQFRGASTSWWIDLSAGRYVELRPGEYLHATRYPFTSFVGMDVSGGSSGCNKLSGRFVVHEIAYNPDGSIQRFAADAEQRCENAAAATFIALRYNSTIGTLLPFGGDYPKYQLSITPATNGRVTGSGLSCGVDQFACLAEFAAAQDIVLTATPEPGFVFAGWTGGCLGGSQVSVDVNSIKRCAAVFTLAVPPVPRNYFFSESESGDYLGRGLTQVFSDLTSTWVASSANSGSTVQLQINTPGPVRETYWTLDFGAPSGQVLTPGMYLDVGTSPSPLVGWMRVATDNSTCSGPLDRFVVHEIEIAGGGLTRFSADAEVHCDDRVPGLFIAIRYRSTMQETRPFGGNYPEYRLGINVPENGRVTGPSIDCGLGGSACLWTGPPGTSLTLTATPEAGYIFAGWSGSCSGAATTTVVVNGYEECSAWFEPLDPAAPRTLLFVQSMAGDYIGQGISAVYSRVNSSWTITTPDAGRSLAVNVRTGISEYWNIHISAPEGSALTPGTYQNATRAAFASFSGVDISASHRGCNQVTGRFVIHEITFGEGGIASLAADIEQHCENQSPGLFVAVRYRSTYQEHRPFAGAYPRYEFTIARPLHGMVIGEAIACGSSGTSCGLTSVAPRTVTLIAVPDYGYVFVGWTGSCHGGETTMLLLNSVQGCEALFEPAIPVGPRTLAVFDGEPGHYVSDGRKRVFSPANSRLSIQTLDDGRGLWISIVGREAASEARWTLQLSAPSVLQQGTYTVSPEFSTMQPGMYFGGDGRGCTAAGAFTIRELVIDPESRAVLRLSVDFIHHCYTLTSPRMTGSIQYRSLSDVVNIRSPHDINGDGRLDLFWHHETEGWIAVWEMNGTRLLNARVATPNRVADTNWRIIGSADFNADGRPDLFWLNRQTGLMAVWYMNGSTYLGPGLLSNNTVSDLNWRIRAIADFNGDSRPDLLWQHEVTGMLAVWILNGVQFVEARLLTPSTVSDTDWKVAGAADFNADGHVDLFWRNRATGVMTVWYLNGTAFIGGGAVTPNRVADMDWGISALADINDDGSPDILWQRRSDGLLSAWLMNGVNFMAGAAFQPVRVSDPAWRIVAPR